MNGVLTLIAIGASALVSGFTVPIWRWVFLQRGWVDEPGPRKIHAHAIPLAGGVSVLCGLLSGWILLAWIGTDHNGFSLLKGPPDPWWVVVLGTLAFCLLGWWDDVVELRPAGKLAGQCLVAMACAGLGARLPIASGWVWVDMLVSVVFMVAVVNAMNFLDNMNGLCAGLGLVAGVQLGLIGGRLGREELSLLGWVLAGACIGFLPYNFPKARSFLGDAGSHVIGGAVALLTMLACDGATVRTHGGSVFGAAGLAPLWVLAVPAYDLVQVTCVRALRRQPIYVGDNNHISHQLARWMGPTNAVLLLWGVAALLGIAGVLSVGRK